MDAIQVYKIVHDIDNIALSEFSVSRREGTRKVIKSQKVCGRLNSR